MLCSQVYHCICLWHQFHTGTQRNWSTELLWVSKCVPFLFIVSVYDISFTQGGTQRNWSTELSLVSKFVPFLFIIWFYDISLTQGGTQGNWPTELSFLRYVIIFWTVCKRKIAVRPPSFLNKNNLTQPGTERNCSTELFFYFSKSGFSLWHFLSY